MTATKRPTIGGFLLGTLFIAGCCIDPFPANATEPVAEPAQFHTVLWEITSPAADVFLEPQVYVATLEGDDTAHWVSDASLKCGIRYQADAYDPAAIPALIADSLLHGGEDHGVAHHWLVFETAACAVVEPPVVIEPPIVPLVTPEIQTPELPAEPVNPTPVDTTPAPVIPAPTEPVVAAPVAPVPPVAEVVAETPEPTIAPPAPESRADVVADQVAAKVPVLAATGVDFATPTGFGILFLLAGICFLGVKRLGKRESK